MPRRRTLRLPARSRARCLMCADLVPWKEDFHACPSPGLTRHSDETIVLFDDFVDREQTQAGALAFSFGGKERPEEFREEIRAHAAAGVGHGEHDILPRSYRAGASSP